MNPIVLSVIKSAILHSGIVFVLLLSVDISPPPKLVQEVTIPVVNAVVIDQNALDQQLNQRKLAEEREKARVQQKIDDAKRKERERRAEIEKKKRLEQERKAKAVAERKAAEKKAADKKKAEQAAAEKKRKEAERKKAEEAKEKKAQEQKEKAEQERKRREREIAQQQKELEEQLLAEQQSRSQQRSEQVLSEVQKYTALIKQAIQQKWLVDDAMIGKSCQLNIRLASNGLVTKVTKLKGDNNVCRSAETAILQVYTLPVSSDPEVFKEFRDFNLTIGHKI